MFLDDERWVPVEDLPRAISDLKTRLEAQKDLRHEYFGTRLVAKSARMRPMGCYPGWSLYEFRIDLDKLGSGNGYEIGHVYVLAGETQAVLLNGTSPPIHALNALTSGEGGASPLRLKDAQGRPLEAAHLEYLRFFCTFVAGEEGPFFIVEAPRDLLSVVGSEDFEDLMVERRRSLDWPSPDVTIPSGAMREFLEANDRAAALKNLMSAVEKPQDDEHVKQTPTDRLNRVAETIGARWDAKILAGPDGKPQYEDGRIRAEGHVLYGRHLFKAQFAIQPTGMVEMVDDEPVQTDLPIRTRKFDPNYPVLLRQGLRREMSPEELVSEIFSPEPARPRDPVSNRLIRGDLNLKGRKLESRIDLDDVWITGDVILDDLRSPFSISLKNTWIGGALRANTLQCEGALKLSRVYIHGYFEQSKPEFRGAPAADRVALNLRGARITSELDLSRARIQGGANLDDTEVGGNAQLSGIQIERLRDTRDLYSRERIHGLSARRAHFKRGLHVGADVEESLRSSPLPARVVGGLWLEGVTVGGNVDVSRIDSILDYMPRNAGNLGDSDRSAWLRIIEREAVVPGFWHSIGPAAGGQLYLLAPIEGSINLESASIGGTLLARGMSGSWLSTYGATVSGSINLQSEMDSGAAGRSKSTRTRLGWGGMRRTDDCLLLSAARVKGSVILNGAHLLGSINANGTTVEGFLDGNPIQSLTTWIEGNVVLSGATIGSDTRFCSARIDGLIQMITGKLKRVQLRPEMIFQQGQPQDASATEPFTCEPAHVGGILIQNATIEELDLYALQVKRNSDEEHSGSIEFSALELSGNLVFFKNRPDRYLLFSLNDTDKDAAKKVLPDLCGLPAKVSGRFRAKSLIVKGEIDLTNLEVEGDIELEGATCARLAALDRIPDDEASQYDVSRPVQTRRNPKLKARSLNIDRLCCTGDVDLSGIEIKESVTARSARAAGKLDLYPSDDDRRSAKDKKRAAIIGGVLDLSRAETPTLAISGESFLDDGVSRRGALKLDRAEIEELRLVGSVPYAADLQNIKLAQVKTPDDPNHNHDRYVKRLLETSEPFNRAIYRAIERSLREDGYDTRADSIYRQMRWRNLREEGWLRRWPGRLHGWLTGFWTKGSRILAWAALLSVPLSFLIFAVRENIAPTTHQLGESQKAMMRSGIPSESEWTSVEILRLVVATHVPVIPLIDGARWEAAENRGLCIAKPSYALGRHLMGLATEQVSGQTSSASDGGCPRDAWSVPATSPAAYSLAMRTLFWIAWPLFLIGVSVRIQRTGRQ